MVTKRGHTSSKYFLFGGGLLLFRRGGGSKFIFFEKMQFFRVSIPSPPFQGIFFFRMKSASNICLKQVEGNIASHAPYRVRNGVGGSWVWRVGVGYAVCNEDVEVAGHRVHMGLRLVMSMGVTLGVCLGLGIWLRLRIGLRWAERRA